MVLLEEFGIIIVLAILGFGGFLLWNAVKKRKPVATNASYELAVDAYERATEEMRVATAKLEAERAVLAGLSKEMASSLMAASGQGVCLTPTQEHELHVDRELERRREQEMIVRG